ncbi:MAG: hypothetical protein ABS73_16020 [Paracoccus sp. SCN 68-21]|nr:MAG: hypothetical protein ABS73_16020 [Paracoccus sp. SCN 68-21]
MVLVQAAYASARDGSRVRGWRALTWDPRGWCWWMVARPEWGWGAAVAAFLVRDCATVASRIDDLLATDQTAQTAPIRWIRAAPYAAVPEAQPSRMPGSHRSRWPTRVLVTTKRGGFCAYDL